MDPGMTPQTREVDLLSTFYDRWRLLHTRIAANAERDELGMLSHELLAASIAIEAYRGRNVKH